jgi:hypothetical protein
MTLQFPNANRHYNADRRCIQFRGVDSVFEVKFDLDEAVLHPAEGDGETALLAAFDRDREKVLRVARARYKSKPGNFFQLSATDFPGFQK